VATELQKRARDADREPDVDALARTLIGGRSAGRCIKQLHACLTELDSDAPLPGILDQIVHLARWVCDGPKPPSELVEDPAEPAQTTRLRALVRALAAYDRWRERFAAVLASVLTRTSGLRLFSEMGLPNPRGLGPETADRLARRLLPPPVDETDLGGLVARMFTTEKDAAWLERVDSRLVTELMVVLGDKWTPLREHARDAIAILVTRTSALGMSEDVRVRSPDGAVRESPFFLLPTAPLESLDAMLDECRRRMALVHSNLEAYGVSIDVVYRLEVMERCIDRADAIVPILLASTSDLERARRARELAASLVRARLRDRSLRGVLGSSTRLLALKIIERAGDTGEHYITTTRKEYFRMLASAAGGGFVTLGTCALKMLTKWGHFAPFVDGALAAGNYAGSFVLMQLLGFTLATKQPSMTAAALAHEIHELRDARPSKVDHELDDLVTMIARICRSQLAAAIGNIGMVIPTALAFNTIYVRWKGHAFLDEETAHHVIESFHPTESKTIWFAALTGVLLWASSLGAGWLENWFVYRRLPDAIAHHRVGRWIGTRTTQWLSRFFAHNVSGFGGNVTLGVLLGMTPVIGAFFGLPLDVRHVTLSTGSLSLAVCSLGFDAVRHAPVQWAALGIAIIGALNFGVSFVLALAIALRARDVGWRERFLLLGGVLKRLFRSPREFVLPP